MFLCRSGMQPAVNSQHNGRRVSTFSQMRQFMERSFSIYECIECLGLLDITAQSVVFGTLYPSVRLRCRPLSGTCDCEISIQWACSRKMARHEVVLFPSALVVSQTNIQPNPIKGGQQPKEANDLRLGSSHGRSLREGWRVAASQSTARFPVVLNATKLLLRDCAITPAIVPWQRRVYAAPLRRGSKLTLTHS